MIRVHVEAWGTLAAFALTAWFLADPSPTPMALFVFIAQPLFVFCGLFYLRKVFRDLRSRRVL